MMRRRRMIRDGRKNLRNFEGKRRIRLHDGMEFSFETDVNAIYVFIDDDKGKPEHKEKVVGMTARSFDNIQTPQFLYLLRLLYKLKAFDWHSKTQFGMQHIEPFQEILKAISRCESRLFIWRQPKANLEADFARKAAFGSGGFFKGQEHFWPEGDYQARLLLITIGTILGQISSAPWTIQKPEAVVFIVDNMNFFSDKIGKRMGQASSSGLFPVLEGTHPDGYDVQVQSFKDKSKIPIWIKIMLGLVDGEAWFYSRLMKEDSEDSNSIDLQGIHWNKVQHDEGSEDFKFDLGVVDEVIAESKAKGGNNALLSSKLQWYWDIWRKWLFEKRVFMNASEYEEENNKRLPYFRKQW